MSPSGKREVHSDPDLFNKAAFSGHCRARRALEADLAGFPASPATKGKPPPHLALLTQPPDPAAPAPGGLFRRAAETGLAKPGDIGSSGRRSCPETSNGAAMTQRLKASPETCAWGYFDATLAAAAEIASGDTITIETVSGGPDHLPRPGAGFHIPPELLAIHDRSPRQLPGHILTGPVAVAGARPGQVLQVDILDIQLRQDWGWNLIRPLAGTLPDDFPTARTVTIPLDRAAMTARLSWGLELPLRPFFGVMGVAPPPAWGRISTIQPRAHGGNLDLKELVAGTTLYLPVFTEGAMFWCGDGHGAQGDGEVCVTAIETALEGSFRLSLRDDPAFATPRAETPTHLITMGLHEDLDRCAERALRDMIAWITARTGLGREDAYMLCSLAGDLRVTQTVNGNKGVHMMMEKALLERRA